MNININQSPNVGRFGKQIGKTVRKVALPALVALAGAYGITEAAYRTRAFLDRGAAAVDPTEAGPYRWREANDRLNSEPLAVQAFDECADRIADRIYTYKALKNNGVDPKKYIGNYGEAQVALDSARTYNFCKENGMHPTSIEDGHYLQDSLEMCQYGLQPYPRNASFRLKFSSQMELDSRKREETLRQLIDAVISNCDTSE